MMVPMLRGAGVGAVAGAPIGGIGAIPGAIGGAAIGATGAFAAETKKQLTQESAAAADAIQGALEMNNANKKYNTAMKGATDAVIRQAYFSGLISKSNMDEIAANKARFDQAKKLQTSVEEVIKTNDALTGAATGGKAMGDRLLPFGAGVGESYAGDREDVEKGFKLG